MNDEEIVNPLEGEVLHQFNLEDFPEPELSGHLWRQEGNQLICQSCSFKHASFIEPGYQLYGITPDGLPMVRKILTVEQRQLKGKVD